MCVRARLSLSLSFSLALSLSVYIRSLRGTMPEWKDLVPDFTYHGSNCYAFLLAKYGQTSVAVVGGGGGGGGEEGALVQCKPIDTFDLVVYQLYESYSHSNYHYRSLLTLTRSLLTLTRSLLTLTRYQLYESYSHSNYHVQVHKRSLSGWVTDLVRRMERGWMVHFSGDEELGFEDCVVKVPPQKLLIGLANAWAHGSEKDSAVRGIRKTLFARPWELRQAVAQLQEDKTPLRGFAFWSLVHGLPAVSFVQTRTCVCLHCMACAVCLHCMPWTVSTGCLTSE